MKKKQKKKLPKVTLTIRNAAEMTEKEVSEIYDWYLRQVGHFLQKEIRREYSKRFTARY